VKPARGLIDRFAEHRVAANLLMFFLLLIGGWSLLNINVQFLPRFDLNFVTVNVVWPGASAEDVETSITTPLEKELRDLDELKEIKSVSREGISQIIIEFRQGADMTNAKDQVKDKVALIRNLPLASEEPIISKMINYEPIAKVLVYGPDHLKDLRRLAHDMDRELVRRGIAKVNKQGLPEEEIAIQIPMDKITELRLPLNQISNIIARRSQDIPAGTVGDYDVARQLRSLNKQRTVKGFHDLPLITDDSGQLLRVGDVAKVERRPKEAEITVTYQNKPAVELSLLRSAKANALKSAKTLKTWANEMQKTLPPQIKIKIYDQRWKHIKQRINVLVKNGIYGFILILMVLFILLNRKVAFWVAMGIPISLLTAMAVLFALDASINMVSMFAFIMTLGIIVDDTIVVGEEALTQIQSGKEILPAIKNAAHKMLPPIVASSLTTVAAFFPLMFISGIIGTILLQIPLVVICVIFASLLECFLILPGHLYHSLKRSDLAEGNHHPIRKQIDDAFFHFRENTFRKLVDKSTNMVWLSLSIAAAAFILSISLVAGGRINFTFFPSPDSSVIRANAEFSAGTAESEINDFLQYLENTLHQTATEFPKDDPLVLTAIKIKNTLSTENYEPAENRGKEFAHLFVELTQPDDRVVRNKDFINAWRDSIVLPPHIENFTITAPRTGPPGKDIDIEISGKNWDYIKKAAVELERILSTYDGVTDVKDDLPFGQQQYIFQVSSTGKSLGLTMEDVGAQLRAAFNGRIAQIFHEPDEEIEVRVILPDNERKKLLTLESLPIITPQKESTPLANVVDIRDQRGLNILRHTDTLLTSHVTAEVDPQITNANKIIDELLTTIIPSVESTYGIQTRLKGRAEEQAETLRDMKIGLIVALCLIYIILAWVFASYTLPVLIMLAIPMGLTGAILGHWILGIDLTILSLFGLFGLSGIVINDSIILVNRYLTLRDSGMPVHKAVVEASVHRLRAVILTSLTTIAGLSPLLFETSLQAQFLIPMAVSIAFGLMFSTFLILFIVPCLLVIHQTKTS